MPAKLIVLEPHIESARMRAYPKRTLAFKAANDMKRTGRSSTVKQVMFPKMSKADMLVAIHNHDYSMAEITVLKVFEGKRPKSAPAS